MKPDYSARKKGFPTMPLAERLYSRIVVNENSGCLEWKGTTNNGYGRITIGSRTDGTRRTVSTHRLSYILNYGEVPEGYDVCHKCDNPKCINPSHLFAGTRQENIDDREAKGRNNPPRGNEHPKAKLSDRDVFSIRKKRMQGMTFRAIAAEYGVNKKTIQDAVKGKHWAHVPFPQPPKEVQ